MQQPALMHTVCSQPCSRSIVGQIHCGIYGLLDVLSMSGYILVALRRWWMRQCGSHFTGWRWIERTLDQGVTIRGIVAAWAWFAQAWLVLFDSTLRKQRIKLLFAFEQTLTGHPVLPAFA